MKTWIILALLAAGATFGVYKWRASQPSSPSAEALARRQTTAVVEPRDISFAVSAAGDIGPAEQVSVRPEINGRVATLPVDVGDRVKKGEVLFTLDDKDLQTEKSTRLTDIERARLQLDKAQRDYERAGQLFEEKLVSQEVYDNAKTEYALAKNALDRSQQALNLLEDQMRKTKIVAPFDCTVLTRPISVGQAVSGSGGFNSGTEVLTIADLNEMIVNAHINQADVTRLSPNQEVDIQVESVAGLRLKGVVERIAPQTTIKNNIRGYAARISLKQLDPRVLPGMTANLSIPIKSTGDALAVPLAAVFTEMGDRFVFVKKGDKYERRSVQIGVNDYDYAEVLAGLAAGEVVALELPPGENLSHFAQKGPGGGPAGPGGGGGHGAAGGGAKSGGKPVATNSTSKTPASGNGASTSAARTSGNSGTR